MEEAVACEEGGKREQVSLVPDGPNHLNEHVPHNPLHSRPTIYTPKVVEEKKVPQVMLKVSEMIQTVTVPSIEISLAEENNKENSRPQQKSKVDGEQTIEEEEEKMAEGDDDTTQIIPWRAQLRKTNSKLSLLD